MGYLKIRNAADTAWLTVEPSMPDVSGAYILGMDWEETDTADREISLYVNGAARTINLSGNLVLGGTLTTTGANTVSTWTDSGLTSGRVVIASTGGLLADEATLAVTRGGLNLSSVALGSVVVCDATSTVNAYRAITSVASGTYFLKNVGTGSTATISWDTASGSGLAPSNATYLTATAEGGLSGEVNLGALSTGLLKATVAVGVATISSITDSSSNWDSAYSHSTATTNVHGLTFTAEGTGGGLDADTVDGSHASSFQAADADLTALAAIAVARGSIITGQDVSPSWKGLTVGTQGQVVATDGTDVAWGAALSSVPTGLTFTGTTRAISLTSGYMIPGGGTQYQVLMSQGASAPSFSTSTYPSTVTGAGQFIRASGANAFAASTLTIPDTYAINTIPFASSANVFGAISVATVQGMVLTVGASPFAPVWSAYTISATATAGNALIGDGTNWTSANILSSVPTGLTYTTTTRALSLTSGYAIYGTSNVTPVNAGGTGAATFTDGGLLVGATTGPIEALAVGLTTQIIVGGGAGTNPAWGTDLPTAITIGTKYIYRTDGTDVPAADGGTGASTLDDGGIVIGNGTGAVEVVAPGLTTQILVGGGLATKPAWGTDIPTAVTIGTAYVYRVGGTDVAFADGGTGISSWTQYLIPYAATTTSIGQIAIGTAGQPLLSAGAGAPPAFGSDLATATTIGTAYIYRVGGTDVAVADGGTNKSSWAVGDIVHATGTTTLAGLADVAIGYHLGSGGVGVIASWKKDHEYDVQDYGAVGDGTAVGGGTDDTTAIQTALTAAAAAGGILIFPLTANYYKITEKLTATLSYGLEICGGGKILYYDATPAASKYMVELTTGNNDIHVHGLTFDGNEDIEGGLLVYNSSAQSTSNPNCILRDNAFNNLKMNTAGLYNDGYCVKGAFKNVILENNRVINVTRAIGTGVTGSSGTTGGVVTPNSTTGWTQHCVHIGNYYENISGGDLVGDTENQDYDGFKFFTPDPSNFLMEDGSTKQYEPATVVSHGNYYKNCRGRSIKVQGIPNISDETIVRDADYTIYGGSDEINLQWGVGTVENIKFFYSDYTSGTVKSPIQTTTALVSAYVGAAYGEAYGSLTVRGLHLYNAVALVPATGMNVSCFVDLRMGAGPEALNHNLYDISDLTVNRGVVDYAIKSSMNTAYATIKLNGACASQFKYSVIGSSATNTNVKLFANGVVNMAGRVYANVSISAFADYSGTVAGTVKATTSASHLLTTGNTVRIYGTTSYNGSFTITVVDATNFYFTDTWVANDATGTVTKTVPWNSDLATPGDARNFSGAIHGDYANSGVDYSTSTVVAGTQAMTLGRSTPFSESNGALTLQGVDALDATTEATIEAIVSYQTLWIPASAMNPTTTNGAAAGTFETATNDNMLAYLAFDGATEEYADFDVVMPEGWNLGTVNAKFYWGSATGSTAGDTCEWELRALTIRNDDALDTATGGNQVISDTLLATNGADLQISGATSAITISGTHVLGNMVHFKVSRNVGGTDDMTEDAWLFGVLIQYQASNSVAAW